MTSHPNLDQLNPEELRALAAQLIQRVETMDKQITHHKSVNEKLATRSHCSNASSLPSAASS